MFVGFLTIYLCFGGTWVPAGTEKGYFGLV